MLLRSYLFLHLIPSASVAGGRASAILAEGVLVCALLVSSPKLDMESCSSVPAYKGTSDRVCCGELQRQQASYVSSLRWESALQVKVTKDDHEGGRFRTMQPPGIPSEDKRTNSASRITNNRTDGAVPHLRTAFTGGEVDMGSLAARP